MLDVAGILILRRDGASGDSTTVGATGSSRWLSWAGMGLTLAFLAVGCGGDDAGDEVAVGDKASVLPADTVVQVVVAGNGEGWVLDGSGNVWRVAPDGTSTKTAELPPYQAAVGRFFDGSVFFGGVRCADNCSATVAELAKLDQSGQPGSTAEIIRHNGPPEDTDGMTVVGASASQLWVSAMGTLAAADGEGAVQERTDHPGGEACVVDDTLHAMTAIDPSLESPADGSGTPPASVLTPGGSPSDTASITLVTSKWDGSQWIQLPESQGGVRQVGLRDANGFCAPGGFEFRDPGTFEVTTRWTPQGGWQEVSDPSVVPDPSAPTTISSTHNVYTLRDGRLERITGTQPSVPIDAALPATAGPGRLPPALYVDDSGTDVFACLAQGNAGPQCDLAPKN